MIFTAAKDSRRVRSVEMFGVGGHQWVTYETTRAKMPRKPRYWGYGWADRFGCEAGGGRPIARVKIDDDGQPIIRRHYGLIRWHA